MPPLELTWYEGQNNLPPLPSNFGDSVVDPNIPPPSVGSIETKRLAPGKAIYGEGMTFKGGSHASILEALGPDAKAIMQDFSPPPPRRASNHAANFPRAAMGQETCRSRFAVAGPRCQAMALGVIAQRVNDKLAFDPKTQRITNHKVANALLDGVEPRGAWRQYYRL